MSYLLIAATPELAVLREGRLMTAEERVLLGEFSAVLARLNEAAQRGFNEGLAAGRAAAEAEAGETLARTLQAFAAELERIRAAARADAAAVALAVVRKLLGALDAAELTARLAEAAADRVLQEHRAELCVRLCPEAAGRVRAPAGLSVLADPALKPLEVRLELGATVLEAGLDSQLRRIAQVLEPAA